MRLITKCRIGPFPRPMPAGLGDEMPKVVVVYDDGMVETLFTFFPDEIMFSESEFVGLTRAQALQLRHARDVSYLRS